MTRSRLAMFAVVVGLAILAASCDAERTKTTEPDQPFHKELLEATDAEPAKTTEAKQPLHKELLKAAADYKVWGRVDDEMRWAVIFCRKPEPGKAHFSASADAATHGQKLYSLFAKEWSSYYILGGIIESPIGQAVVKESWISEETKEVKADDVDESNVIRRIAPKGDIGDSFYPFAVKDGKVYKASKQGDLFIMLKLNPKTEGTDVGWVYGTVTPDGKKVTSAGKVESCMKCHQEAKHDRLFGLAAKK